MNDSQSKVVITAVTDETTANEEEEAGDDCFRSYSPIDTFPNKSSMFDDFDEFDRNFDEDNIFTLSSDEETDENARKDVKFENIGKSQSNDNVVHVGESDNLPRENNTASQVSTVTIPEENHSASLSQETVKSRNNKDNETVINICDLTESDDECEVLYESKEGSTNAINALNSSDELNDSIEIQSAAEPQPNTFNTDSELKEGDDENEEEPEEIDPIEDLRWRKVLDSLRQCQMAKPLPGKRSRTENKITSVTTLIQDEGNNLTSTIESVELESELPLRSNSEAAQERSNLSQSDTSEINLIEIDECDKSEPFPVDVQPQYLSPRPSTSKRKLSISDSQLNTSFTEYISSNRQNSESLNIKQFELISKHLKLEINVVENVIRLLLDQCTVPFISRYRQSYLKGLSCDKVREISNAFKELKKVQQKIAEQEERLRKLGLWTSELKNRLEQCMETSEVKRILIPFIEEDYDTQNARKVGLEVSAKMIMNGASLDPFKFIQIDCPGLENLERIRNSWKSLITDIIYKDLEVMDYFVKLHDKFVSIMEVELNLEKAKEFYATNQIEIIRKYDKFDNFKQPITNVHPEQVFQINRGEREGLLRVFIVFHEEIEKRLRDFCMKKWSKCSPSLLSDCVYHAWDDLIKTHYAQYIRWQLTHEAYNVALNVFRDNIKYLLLEPPIRGKTVLGIDPGYDSGCKLAVISPWGVPISTQIIFINTSIGKINACAELKKLIVAHECDHIALGNGPGYREVESFLIALINEKLFHPVNVHYKIIPEDGIYHYSISPEAASEFPNLEPEIIKAVTIARRLQDPLSELVKMDPKKLSVGMFSRDIPREKIEEVFNEVVCECVSFVGVDINIASATLLSKVSGLTLQIAKRIVDARKENGPFISREQLLEIKGIGLKQYEQCAGFVRIIPETSQASFGRRYILMESFSCYSFVFFSSEEFLQKFNFLDATIIHPESYKMAEKFINYIGAEKNQIGTDLMTKLIDNVLTRYDIKELAIFCCTTRDTISHLVEALRQPLNADIRIGNLTILILSKLSCQT
ncbi:S1 RNA-binding domain-containing protein 1-like protein [Dinothrombium tinctorium]|uniref:S1 RNA-binding domain-containing protein 1-like protein n=1 Tax=Dinothrombium tinctorium TaxID=1965070 RepID=A0A3S3PQ88_9ACAR|nr:S1 RNA-binding domain-containing protein 1-like protein [Dinothrombium tinctorium]RWS06108.1 S1 RNA-binding domain-containing protein 1-like protein [Dinothrombium tinctorium]